MDHPPGVVVELDVRPLTEPIDEPVLAAFVADAKTHDRPWRRMTTGVPRPGVGDLLSALMPAVIPLIGIGALLGTGGWSLVDAVRRFTLQAPFPLNLVVAGLFGVIMIAVLGAVVRVIRLIRSMIIPRSWWEAAQRLTGFAARNALHYGHDEPLTHPGMIFDIGSDRVAERRLVTTSGRGVEIGNFRYTISGENRDQARVCRWGYVAITLDRRLPHLLLDAKANNRSVFGIQTSNLPVDLARGQRLSLGREFDDAFTLYAPSEYGRDAFMIFTPDLMALFIDRLGPCDVEIVDDMLFVYGNAFDLLDPVTYTWLQDLVSTVGARTVRRTERYRDDFALLESHPTLPAADAVPDRAPRDHAGPSVFAIAGDHAPMGAANTVAVGGRRLRRRRWGLWSVVGLLVIALYAYDQVIGPLLGLPTFNLPRDR